MDGDKVAITEIKGMKLKEGQSHEFISPSINETIHEVKVLKPNIFTIGDMSKYECQDAEGGMARQVKVPKDMIFNSLSHNLLNPKFDEELQYSYFEKYQNNMLSHVCY